MRNGSENLKAIKQRRGNTHFVKGHFKQDKTERKRRCFDCARVWFRVVCSFWISRRDWSCSSVSHKDVKERVAEKPRISKPLSHQKRPRATTLLVLSGPKAAQGLNSKLRLAAASSAKIATLEAKVVVKTAARAGLLPLISHSVRHWTASKAIEKNR